MTCDGSWYAVVNNADPIPEKVDFDGQNFSSYNAASVNNDGFVVFRARSTGGDNPSTGIFVRDMPNGKLVRQAGRRTLVPPPNNLNTTFFEFPSFPRMSIINDYIATRGNHDPVLKYELERRVLAEDEDDADTTRVGNTGIFFNLRAKDDTETAPDTSPNFKTGMNKLGAVPGIDPQTLLDYSIYQVPGFDPEEHDGTVFDVFPGSPVQDDGTIAFKGNYAIDGLSQTGVFHRKLQDVDGGGEAPLFVVANSLTTIPDGAGECQTITFGSCER